MTLVATTSGKVRGAIDAGVHAFLGIPYADSPVGDLRFLAPRPHQPWDGVRDAVAYGASAPQPAQGFTIIPEPVVPGDNCLNLNVFTPDPGASGLPVLVWIHGGGFVNGCNASPWYHGRSFARDGVVLVTLNYRLGVEGFLAIRDAPANRGVRDWIAGLEWVQENIAAFGGDPTRVAIAGQSAGGVACAALLAVPRAAGLFHRVIAMSGAGQGLGAVDDAEVYAGKLADRLGVEPTRAGFAAVPPERLIEAQQKTAGGGASGGTGRDIVARFRAMGSGRTRLFPLVDGDLVPEAPIDAVRAGAGGDVPVITGTVAEEVDGIFAAGAAGVDDDHAVEALTALGLPPEAAAGFRSAQADLSAAQVLGRAATEHLFRVPCVRLGEARAKATAPTWLYRFDWRSTSGFGAVHCIDVPFAFDLLDAEHVPVIAGEPPQALADDVHGAFVRFISGDDPGWPAYDLDSRPVMTFDVPCSVVQDPDAAARVAWEGVR
jgi:para-nitrobenzyl esterase